MADRMKKSWFREQWEEIRPHFKWEVIRFILGGGLVTALVAIFRSALSESISVFWALVVLGISSAAFAVVSLYLRSQRGVGVIAIMMLTYLPIVLGLAFCVWAYFVGSTLLRLDRNSQAFRSNLDLYMKPRTLTEEQISAVAAYLSQRDPHDIKVVVHANDAEATNYMGQIVSGLIGGGWKIASTNYVYEQMNQGISLITEQPGQPQNPDPKHPTPEAILKAALEQAKIPVSGSGGAYNRAAYSISITVGPRPFIIESEPRRRPAVPPPPGWQ